MESLTFLHRNNIMKTVKLNHFEHNVIEDKKS